MPQPLTPPAGQGEGDEPFKPFDRQALEATLADALRDAEGATAAGAAEAAAPDPARRPRSRPRPRPQAGSPDPAVPDAPRAGGDNAAGDPRPVPRPTLLGSGLTGPAGLLGGSTLGATPRPAAQPGAGPAPLAVPPRPLAAPGGLAPPGKLVSGLSPAPAGFAPTADGPAAEQPTIPIRRPKRAEPAAPAASAQAPPAPAPAPPRPAVAVAAWSPSDDDILPRAAARRRGRRHRA